MIMSVRFVWLDKVMIFQNLNICFSTSKPRLFSEKIITLPYLKLKHSGKSTKYLDKNNKFDKQNERHIYNFCF